MPNFEWKGKNKYKEAVKGERKARSKKELIESLQREQITDITVTPKRKDIQLSFLEKKSVKLKELAIYSRQLSVLIDAELPLVQGLGILAQQTKNKYFKKVIIKIREDVEAGSTLNQAKRKFPKVFDDLYCNLIGSGEQSGSLDIMLRRLAEYLEKIVKLRAQVKQAMVYPVTILVFSITVVIFMMWKIIPVFSNIFIQLGADLPALTQMLVDMSNFVQKYILFIFGGMIGGFIFFKYYKGTEVGKKTLDPLILKIPLFGSLIKKVGLSRITRTMSTLLAGGVPMLDTLRITSTTAGNTVMENHLMKTRNMVSEGKSLTQSLQRSGNFPFMMLQMIGVGEETGTLDAMLGKLAVFYDEEVEVTVGALLSIMEPILLIFIGGLVGTMVISMYLPIFDLINQI